MLFFETRFFCNNPLAMGACDHSNNPKCQVQHRYPTNVPEWVKEAELLGDVTDGNKG